MVDFGSNALELAAKKSGEFTFCDGGCGMQVEASMFGLQMTQYINANKERFGPEDQKLIAKCKHCYERDRSKAIRMEKAQFSVEIACFKSFKQQFQLSNNLEKELAWLSHQVSDKNRAHWMELGREWSRSPDKNKTTAKKKSFGF